MARRDGRLANQLRPPSMDLRPLLRADGSARFRFGDSTVGGTASPLDGWLVGWKLGVSRGRTVKGTHFFGGTNWNHAIWRPLWELNHVKSMGNFEGICAKKSALFGCWRCWRESIGWNLAINPDIIDPMSSINLGNQWRFLNHSKMKTHHRRHVC